MTPELTIRFYERGYISPSIPVLECSACGAAVIRDVEAASEDAHRAFHRATRTSINYAAPIATGAGPELEGRDPGDVAEERAEALDVELVERFDTFSALGNDLDALLDRCRARERDRRSVGDHERAEAYAVIGAELGGLLDTYYVDGPQS